MKRESIFVGKAGKSKSWTKYQGWLSPSVTHSGEGEVSVHELPLLCVYSGPSGCLLLMSLEAPLQGPVAKIVPSIFTLIFSLSSAQHMGSLTPNPMKQQGHNLYPVFDLPSSPVLANKRKSTMG
jgi:hypothetical protein